MSNHDKNERCENCKHYEIDIGACLRYPPRPVPTSIEPDAGIDVEWHHPQPHAKAWCGEWKPAEGGA